jgi:hypothetical protein
VANASNRQRAIAFAAVAGCAGVLFVDACGLIFDCGCTSLWAGGAALCNVHHATGPHCPWCAHPVAGATAFFGVLIAQAALIYGPLPAAFLSIGIWGRLAAALVAFPVAATGLGLMHGTWYGYWG